MCWGAFSARPNAVGDGGTKGAEKGGEDKGKGVEGRARKGMR